MPTIEFTALVKDIIKSSGKLAMQYGEEYIGSEHLLLAIIDESLKQTNKSEQILKIFKRFKLDVFALIEDIEATFDHDKPRLYLDQVPLSSSAENCLKYSYLEAKACNSDMIDAEHVLLAYLRQENSFYNQVLLPKHKLAYQDVKKFIEQKN